MAAPFPPPARADIDWASPTISLLQVNGHIESRWTCATGQWSEPSFVQSPLLHMHGLATALQYGQEIYEGMKAFRRPDGEIQIVRPTANAARLNHSAALASIQPVPEDHFLRCIQLAVGLNAEFVPPHGTKAMLYIRPFVFGSGPWFQLSPTNEYTFCVFVAPLLALHGLHPVNSLVVDEFDRAAPRGVGSGKIGGNYAPVMRWSEKAKQQGFPITLHLDSKTRSEIEEFSSSGFIGLRQIEENGQVKTTLSVPDSDNIVASITSDCIQQIARSLGWTVQRRRILFTELVQFTEVVACGTAVSVLPIKSITRRSTSDKFVYLDENSKAGPCAEILARKLDEIYTGKVEDNFWWMMKIKEPIMLQQGTVTTKPAACASQQVAGKDFGDGVVHDGVAETIKV